MTKARVAIPVSSEHRDHTTQFLSIDDARAKIDAWRIDYDAHRPHSLLDSLIPSEFAEMRHGNRTSEVAIL